MTEIQKTGDDDNDELARAGGSNTRYVKALEAKSRPYRRQIKEDRLAPDVANKMLIETFAETIVLGWTGIEDKDGPVQFSVDNCRQLLTELPDLFEELREVASNAGTFREYEIEEDAGN
jgi:hypothetical protein